MDGMLTDVVVLPGGSSATQAQAVGDLSVTVEDPTDFAATVDPTDPNEENVGTLDICGVRYDYTTVDPDAGVITLATPLSVAVDEADPVLVVSGGEIAQDWLAIVDLGDGDNVPVPLSFGTRALLPEGHYDPPVPVVVADDLSMIVDAPGWQPMLSNDAVPPSVSDAIVNAQASADGKNTIWYATPDSGPHALGDTWFDAGAIKRWDGTTWQTTQLDGSLAVMDASIGSAKIAYLDAGKITTGTLSAIALSGVTITGSTIQTAATGQRIEIDSSGVLSFWNSAGTNASTINGSGNGLSIYSGIGNGLWLGTQNAIFQLLDAGQAYLTSNQNFYVGTSTTNTAFLVSSAGFISSPLHSTTTSAANTFIATGGQIMRVTSDRASKLVIEPIVIDRLRPLLDVDVCTWFDRRAAEEYAAELSGGAVSQNPTPLTRIPGLIAEDVVAAGLEEFVLRAEETDEIAGVAYDRVGAALIPLIREQRDQIADLTARVVILEQRTPA